MLLESPEAPPPSPAPQPGEPQPQADELIVRAAVHPAIGIARVGDSEDGTYVGPEVYPTPVLPPGSYRDASGALKRQAVRFRVYGYNAAGEVVRELTAGRADLRWRVHVANRKAAWYQWVIALDIPEAAKTVCPLRNAKVADRASLAIDAGEVTIEGRGTGGPAHVCRGAFQGTPVELGALRTDEEGRLLFLPGRGVSASPEGKPIYPKEKPNPFINADGWYDDVCDGPVHADVTIDGRTIPCEGAWVLSAPPDYAPNVVGVRTLYDLLHDLFVGAGWMPFPERISFRRHVYPILHRLTGLGWVNKGYEVQYGNIGPFPFADPALAARLADAGDEAAELRRQVLNSFRDPAAPSPLQLPWPWIYGDAMEVPAGDSPRQNATVSSTQYRILQLWAAGRFEDDWGEPVEPPREIAEVPLAEQPATLDRAALEYALADAFHPGCEVTWPIRHLTMWQAPFRLRQRPPGVPEPDYGEVLTPAIALSPTGPLHAQGPGDLTRWMGLPWQADTAFCRSGYDQEYDPYVPTFWPATVPNQVLTPEIYRQIMDAGTPEERARAFARRASWVAPLNPGGHADTAQQMTRMVEIFGAMGFLEVLEGPEGDPVVPNELMVASFGPAAEAARAEAATTAEARRAAVAEAAPARLAAPRLDAEQELRGAIPPDATWTSPDEAEEAPLPVRRSDR